MAVSKKFMLFCPFPSLSCFFVFFVLWMSQYFFVL